MTLRSVIGIISTLLRALVFALSGRQVLPERRRDPDHGLPVGNVELREQLRFGDYITLYEKIIAFLIQTR